MASLSEKVCPNKRVKVEKVESRCTIVAEYLNGNTDLANIVQSYLGHSTKFVVDKQAWVEWPVFRVNHANHFKVTIMSEEGKHFQDISGTTPALKSSELEYLEYGKPKERDSSHFLFAPSVHGDLLLITVVEEWYA